MSEPLEIKDLLKKKLFNHNSLSDLKKDFDLEYSIRLAADTLRMSLLLKDKKQILMQIGALGALQIELEDLKFLTKSDLNYIISLMV